MFRLTSSFVLFLVFGATTTNVRALCDLECPSNAPCRFGEADFSDRTGLVAAEQETHLNGMHCDCPIGEYLLIVQISSVMMHCTVIEISRVFPSTGYCYNLLVRSKDCDNGHEKGDGMISVPFDSVRVCFC